MGVRNDSNYSRHTLFSQLYLGVIYMQSSEPILSVNLSVHSENTYACAAITAIEI